MAKTMNDNDEIIENNKSQLIALLCAASET